MSTGELGPWEPMSVNGAVELFKPASFRWWLSGGHALEAHFDESWRDHDDTDISILRSEAGELLSLLNGWDIHVAAAGVLTPWDGHPLLTERSENNLWCRPSPEAAWALDVTISDGDEHDWIYRRDPTIRRPWQESVLTRDGGVPYLAPELQLLFKSKDVRPKDDLDAATVIPLFTPTRRTWLAERLPAEHPWQTAIAGCRAAIALEADVELMAAGRSSQAWRTVDGEPSSVVRVPIPNSGRLISYRSEVVIGDLLSHAGHPVSTWRLKSVDGVECSVGSALGGSPIKPDTAWSQSLITSMAALLRDLHQLPVEGWGPLENRSDVLAGTSASVVEGIVDRWFHAPIWPFDGSRLDDHPIASLAPDLVGPLSDMKAAITEAASEPFGLVHSDLHRQHILVDDDGLSGLLDFGDAFTGSTAWDFALLRWYYGAENTRRVTDAYQPESDLAARGALLAAAVGCYKVAKSPNDRSVRARLRSLLNS